MEQEKRLVKLRQVIEEAFEDIPYPGDHNITDENCCPECQELAKVFRAKHWREITLEYLEYAEKHYNYCTVWSAFGLLEAPAARFFLPAYLLIVAGRHDDCGSIEDSVQLALMPDSSEPDPQFLVKWEPLTPEQKRAAKLFLEYLIEAYPEEYVLDLSEYTLGWPPDEEMLDGPTLALKRYCADK